MDQSHHDHSAHANMDMGHGDMGDRCSMNMLFTWDPTNLCIIFRSWHVRGTVSLIFSLLAIVALTAGYEFVREVSRRYEAKLEAKRGILRREGPGGTTIQKDGQLIKALLYALQVFYSFFIMLLFMTYNGWVMLAVAVGAFVGYMIWGNTSAVKSVACH
ncbi:hypothetical protein TWF102_006011 [Orbilia oligospora]|uniref:Copper transport protein n=2 Tax=Orbilia oligospora TaxID=2813651 RepID=A0A7C8J6R7_ORBOL|nr:hypothetical protein TWF102_006011 [Orbilia oligospora]KAF3115102.1 hypothetical protein TWF706_007220 [Orbilia oligospora]KAF3120678.1 hypothetical protein TWF594_003683 [Orbilia oligospora]